MEVDQLIDVLVRSTDQNLRDRAEQQLAEAENANLDEQLHLEKSVRWMKLDPQLRFQIKGMLMDNLSTPGELARAATAQAIAAIGAVEIFYKEWEDLVSQLLAQCQSGNDYARHGALACLGFLCDGAKEDTITPQQADNILNAIATGLNEQAPVEIRRVAIIALNNSIFYVKKNFEAEGERDSIMQLVRASCVSSDLEVQETAFQCLVSIVMEYYEYMDSYMLGLYQMTVAAMDLDQTAEPICLQAIEIWNSICDTECEILEEEEDRAVPVEHSQCRNYAGVAVGKDEFIPSLTRLLTRQPEEEAEEDDWSPAIAAGACLSLLANTVGDDVVPRVMPFVYENIGHANWRHRDAATLAFGSIMDGPEGEEVSRIIIDALPGLVQNMKDRAVQVKDTTAWTIGRIVKFHPHTIPDALHEIINALGHALADEARVANQAAWAIHNLANVYASSYDKTSSPLTPYFADLMRALMTTSDRDDVDESNLRVSSYEAMNALILAAPLNCLGDVEGFLPLFMQRMQQTLERNEQAQLQGHIASALTCMVQRLNANVVRKFADDLMSLCNAVFSSESTTVQEETLTAVSALAIVLGSDFDRFMPSFHEHLLCGLKNHEESAVCLAAVCVVGDLARALETALCPFCDDIIGTMLHDLRVPTLGQDVKIAIITCFGDIALGICGNFRRYFEAVINVLQDVSQTSSNDPSHVEFLNRLRQAVLEAYTGILQGLKEDKAQDVMLGSSLQHLLQFIEYVWNDQNKDDAVIKNIVGILGDIALTLGHLHADVRDALKAPIVKNIIHTALQSNRKAVKVLANWTRETIKNLGD